MGSPLAFGDTAINEQTNMIYVTEGDTMIVIDGATHSIIKKISLLREFEDKGDFVFWRTGESTPAYEWLQSSGVIERVVKQLNWNHKLPHNIKIISEECGEANAYWYSSSNRIVLCDEYVYHISGAYQAWLSVEPSATRLNEYVSNVVRQTLFHEAGHALIDVYNLPITGKEENVADQFAAWWNMHLNSEEVQDKALSYRIESESSDFGPIPYWSTHGLDEQRWYNLHCYVAGYDSDSWSANVVHEDRLPYCEKEWDQMGYSWRYILEDYSYWIASSYN